VAAAIARRARVYFVQGARDCVVGSVMVEDSARGEAGSMGGVSMDGVLPMGSEGRIIMMTAVKDAVSGALAYCIPPVEAWVLSRCWSFGYPGLST